MIEQICSLAMFRLTLVARTLTGFKNEHAGYRNVAEYSFYNSEYRRLNRIFGPRAKRNETETRGKARRELAEKVLAALIADYQLKKNRLRVTPRISASLL